MINYSIFYLENFRSNLSNNNRNIWTITYFPSIMIDLIVNLTAEFFSHLKSIETRFYIDLRHGRPAFANCPLFADSRLSRFSSQDYFFLCFAISTPAESQLRPFPRTWPWDMRNLRENEPGLRESISLHEQTRGEGPPAHMSTHPPTHPPGHSLAKVHI